MSSFSTYLERRSDHLIELAIEHAQVVAISLLIAMLIGITLGVLTFRHQRASTIAIAVVGTFLTIPSFALLALLIPLLGLGSEPTIVALVMYGLLPIVRNTVIGLQGVDSAVSESAKGMGMTGFQRLVRIELPLAWPVIITGVRVAAVMLIGIAAIAAAVNGPGLGGDIFDGLARVGSPAAVNLVLGGTLGIIVLALLFDAVFFFIEKLTTSKGLRG